MVGPRLKSECWVFGLMRLICHCLIQWPQASHLTSGPQREMCYIIYKIPFSSQIMIVKSILPLVCQHGTRDREPPSLHFEAEVTFHEAENSGVPCQSLKQLRFVTAWAQVKFFRGDLEIFKKGEHVTDDPSMGIRDGASVAGLEKLW